MRKRIVSLGLILAMGVSLCASSRGIEAKTKQGLNKKSIIVGVGKSKKIKLKILKNAGKKSVKWKLTKKKIAKIKKKKRKSVVIKGLKPGKTTLICSIKSGKSIRKYRCKITVKKSTGQGDLNNSKGDKSSNNSTANVDGMQSEKPTTESTLIPTGKPTTESTGKPDTESMAESTGKPDTESVAESTDKPITNPITKPTTKPTDKPITEQTAKPTDKPVADSTMKPTEQPIIMPTLKPTSKPDEIPTMNPTGEPNERTTAKPTLKPTEKPTPVPTEKPTPVPTERPTTKPTSTPVSEATSTPYAGPIETFIPYSGEGFDKDGHASFEQGASGFNNRGTTEISISNDGREGKCIYVTGRTDTWHGAILNITDTVEPGATYKVSGWVKQMSGEPCEIKCSVELSMGGNTTWPAIDSKGDAVSGAWQLLEGEYKIPDDFDRESDRLGVYFEIPGSASADFYLDDVTIAMVKTADSSAQELIPVKDALSTLADRIGTCATYNGGWGSTGQLQEKNTLKFIKNNYNSITLENEMKPDSLLGWSCDAISVKEAKNLGYYIPENYSENTVPKLNFDSLDNVLKTCADNNLQMRGHTLVWHQQTRNWFFCEGYTGSDLVDKSTMNAREEFYVRTVIKHVMDKEKELTGSAGSIVYAWDVVNEYLNHNNGPQTPTWTDIYGEQGINCTYVKKAYEYAYAQLEEYGVTDKVTLFYNDYNTYMNVDDLISLVNYINEGEKAKICGGIGMQSHLDISYPSASQFGRALEAFMNTGLEVQITELDITTTGERHPDSTPEDQAAYAKELMKTIREKQNGRDKSKTKGITGITIWGLYDSVSWRKSQDPLFFTSLTEPKPSYYAIIEALK